MSPRRRVAPLVAVVVGVLVALAAAGACGSVADRAATASTSGRTVVVTYPILGTLVRELVGDAATVKVLLPDGVDPHDYRPSARDTEAVDRADLIVANGLDLEEGLLGAIDAAEAKGTPVFRVAEHASAAREGDPHLWVDPVSMREAMAALAPTLRDRLGLDLGDRPAVVDRELTDLDARTRATLDTVPPDRRLLVTGHESMGYFAARYGFRLVGALIPSSTSQAAPSAADLVALKALIEQTGAPVVFNEIGTPKALARALADETGVTVVELATHTLPGDESYGSFIDQLATGIAGALGGAT